MATIYVSYKSEELPFVQAVMSHLDDQHDIRVDYNLSRGVNWPARQLQDMRECEVCLIFVSRGTRGSDFQNAEIGSARFCSVHIDEKLVIPALIDPVDPPRPLSHIKILDLTHRNPTQAATDIRKALERRAPRIRLFVSHAHRDRDIAERLVDVLRSNLMVPEGALRCTSVPGYKLDLGTMAAPQLRRELGSASGVIALLTPNSVSKDWVLFELGAAWVNAGVAIPLLAGGLEDIDIPGPLRGAAGGQMDSSPTLDHLIDQLATRLGWLQNNELNARNKRYEFVEFIQGQDLCAGSAGRRNEGEFHRKTCPDRLEAGCFARPSR